MHTGDNRSGHNIGTPLYIYLYIHMSIYLYTLPIYTYTQGTIVVDISKQTVNIEFSKPVPSPSDLQVTNVFFFLSRVFWSRLYIPNNKF